MIGRLKRLVGDGVIKRFGLIVRHRALGFRANAMVVWDIADDEVDAVAAILAAEHLRHLVLPPPAPAAAMALQSVLHDPRPRPAHGLQQIAALNETAGLRPAQCGSVFRRCFKQRGARFSSARAGAA